MNTNSSSFLCCFDTSTLPPAFNSHKQLPHNTKAAASKFGCPHSTPWFSISVWIWKCPGGSKDPTAAPEPAGLRTCLIELYSNNLQQVCGLSSAVLICETGEGQILPFFPSLLAGFAGAVWTLVGSLFGSGHTHTLSSKQCYYSQHSFIYVLRCS